MVVLKWIVKRISHAVLSRVVKGIQWEKSFNNEPLKVLSGEADVKSVDVKI